MKISLYLLAFELRYRIEGVIILVVLGYASMSVIIAAISGRVKVLVWGRGLTVKV